MTTTLHDALKRLSVIREGFVVRNLDGSAKTDSEARRAIERICRRAGLPVRQWHTLRHTFGTHAALFGVNPWRLQTWLGHKRIDETMLYVHVAEAHARELPEPVHEAAQTEVDPDRRIVAMLGARGSSVAKPWQKPRRRKRKLRRQPELSREGRRTRSRENARRHTHKSAGCRDRCG